MVQQQKSKEVEEIVGLIVDERRSGGVPEQQPGVLQIFDTVDWRILLNR